MGRNLTGRPINPLEVGFSYPKALAIDEYERIFCAPVLFDQKQTCINFDAKVGNTPVLTPNPSLLAHFENYTVEEINYLLGFSDPTVFCTAFKKWSGNTPREYREMALAEDGSGFN